MNIRGRHRAGRAVAALVGLLAMLSVAGGPAHAEPNECATPPEMTEGELKLPHLAERLKAHQPVSIVAIGGASTIGRAAGSPDLSYPHRLGQELQRHFPDSPITVINKGVPRQSARQMFERFATDVFAEDPVMVIWEVGVNDAVRGTDIDDFAQTLQDGVEQLKNRAIDIMFMDMQFSRSSATVINFEAYLQALHRVGDLDDVFVFPRYAMMRYWSEEKVFNFDDVAEDDRAKLAARVYDCLGRKMAELIKARHPVKRMAVWCAALAALLPMAARGAELCDGPPGGLPIVTPLAHVAARIDQGGPLTIVAIGSSSTAGIGATSPDRSYPNRLEAELRQRFPALDIRVVNRGKGGEDAPEEVARLSADVVALHPDLAIWQVGTNALLRRDDISADGELIREGVALLKRHGIDVVLMDLQVAPRVLDRASYPLMEKLIADTADKEQVGLFRRFALMRYWEASHASGALPMVGSDGLHMTDAGYHCLAARLAAALEANWQAETKLARRAHAATDAIVGLRSPSAVPGHDILPAAPMRRKDATPFN